MYIVIDDLVLGPPRTPVPILRVSTLGLLGVGRGEQPVRLLLHLAVSGDPGHAHVHAAAVHPLHEAGDDEGRVVGAHGPRGVGVADHEEKVRRVLDHGTVPDKLLAHIDQLAVDAERDPAAELHAQSRRGHYQIGIELLSNVEVDPVFSHRLDARRDDVRLGRVQGLVEIAVGRKADALLPGKVARLEMGIDGDPGRQELGRLLEKKLSHGLWEPLAQEDGQLRVGHVPPPLDVGEQPLRPPRSRNHALPLLRGGDDVRRAPLQHGDVFGRLGHAREQRDRRGAAANDYHFLVGVIIVLGPELRVDDFSLETIQSGNVNLQGLIEVIVSRAKHRELGRVGLPLPFVFHCETPAVCLGRPVCRENLVAKVDVFVETVLRYTLSDVGDDKWPFGDGTLMRPWLPRETERVQIRVGPDARILPQIPRSTNIASVLENGKLQVGQPGL